MFEKILVVCTGNICRSPVAALCLQQYFPGKLIDSAGIQTQNGLKADPHIIVTAARKGLSLDGHRSRQFTSALGRQYELILVMEREHLAWIDRIAPEARGKTLLFGCGISPEEIPDPYGRSDAVYDAVYQQIELASSYWQKTLCTSNTGRHVCQR